MPVKSFEIERLLRKSLVGETVDQFMLDGAKHSVGTNPRSVKRLANTFLLLKLVSPALDETSADRRLLFLVLAMQAAYPEFHQELSAMRPDEPVFAYLVGALDEVAEVNGVPDLEISPSWGIRPRGEDDFRRFCRVLCSLLADLVPDAPTATADRTRQLEAALTNAAITATDSSSVEDGRARSGRVNDPRTMLDDLEDFVAEGHGDGVEIGRAFLDAIMPSRSVADFECEEWVNPQNGTIEWFLRSDEGRLAVLRFNRRKRTVNAHLVVLKGTGDAVRQAVRESSLADKFAELRGAPAADLTRADMPALASLLGEILQTRIHAR